MKLVDWRKGDAPVVSISYVRAFVKNAPELHSYKTSHIDPLRAKKATTKVRAMGTGMARGVAAAPPLQHPAHYPYKPIGSGVTRVAPFFLSRHESGTTMSLLQRYPKIDVPSLYFYN